MVGDGVGDRGGEGLRRLAALLATVALGGCPREEKVTHLLVTVNHGQAISVDQLRIGVSDGGTPLFAPVLRPRTPDGALASGSTIAILLADNVAGHMLDVAVTGLAGGEEVVSGAAVASPIAGGATPVVVVLDKVRPKLLSIKVTPAISTLPRGTVKQLTATGVYTDGSSVDLTGQVQWTTKNSAIASLDSTMPGLVRAVELGNSDIFAASGAVLGVAQVFVNDARLLSLTITPTSPQLPLGVTQQLKAIGSYSDSNTRDLTATCQWTSSDPAVASVSDAPVDKGLLRTLSTGLVQVTAMQDGVSTLAPVSVVSAALKQIMITPPNPKLAKGTTVQALATGIYTDNTALDLTSLVVWTSPLMGVATVSNNGGSKGLITAAGAGDVDITAMASGVTGSIHVTVTAATLTGVMVTPPSPTLPKGTALQLSAIGTYSDNTTQDVTTDALWSTGNSVVVTVGNSMGSKGQATAASEGAAAVTATVGTISGAATVTVTNATLSTVAVTPTQPSLAKGTTLRFTATGIFSDGSMQNLTSAATWQSSANNVASVASDGTATANAKGSASISADVMGKSGATTLAVTDALLLSVTLTPANPSLAAGTTLPLTATGTYSDGSSQDVTAQSTWLSSDETIAVVDNGLGSDGKVTALRPGQVTISGGIGQVMATVKVTVTAATLSTIAITPPNPSLAAGTTLPLAATGTYTDNSTQDLTAAVTWSSADATVVAISNTQGSEGLATGLKAGGPFTITAQLGSVTGTTPITVAAATLKSISVTPTGRTIAAGRTEQFAATGTYSDGSTQDLTGAVTWTSSDDTVATVSSSSGTAGLARGLMPGGVDITARSGSISGMASLVVSAATLVSIAVTPTAPSLAAGTSLPLAATGTYSDNTTQDLTAVVTWISSVPSVAAISGAMGSAGEVTGLVAGTSTATAKLGAISGTTLVTVTAATLKSIAISPTNPSFADGTTVQLVATGTYSDSSTQEITSAVTWFSDTQGVAQVSNSLATAGLATALIPGTAMVSAKLDGKTATTLLTVTTATLQSISVTPTLPTVPAGNELQFHAVGTYSNNSTQDLTDSVTWSSQTEAVAVVSNAQASAGLVTALVMGSSKITAALGSISGSSTLTVSAATLKSIKVTPTGGQVAAGTKVQLKAEGKYSDSSTLDLTASVTWKSSDVALATVSNSAESAGLVTTLTSGMVTLTAELGMVMGTASLDVTPATLMSIAITPSNPSLAVGTTIKLHAVGTFSDSTTQDLTDAVTWTSIDPARVAVSNAAGARGLTSGVVAGAPVAVTAEAGSVMGTTNVTVTSATLMSLAVSPSGQTIATAAQLQLVAIGTFSDMSTQDLTTQVTWASVDPTIADVSNVEGEQGRVTGVAVGSTTINATFSSITGGAPLTVN